MPNGADQDLQEAENELARLRVELAQTRAEAQALLQQCGHTLEAQRIDSAKVVNALDCAVQTVDALIAWMPQGLILSPEVSGCKERLDRAMQAVMGRQ